MLVARSGELRVAREKVSLARDSTDRTRAQRVADDAKSDVDYHKREIARLKKSLEEQD